VSGEHCDGLVSPYQRIRRFRYCWRLKLALNGTEPSSVYISSWHPVCWPCPMYAAVNSWIDTAPCHCFVNVLLYVSDLRLSQRSVFIIRPLRFSIVVKLWISLIIWKFLSPLSRTALLKQTPHLEYLTMNGILTYNTLPPQTGLYLKFKILPPPPG
jgi:hypothetical protein